jgi:hypothetical protein
LRKGNFYTTEEHDSLVIDPKKGLFFWNSRALYGDIVDYLIKVKGQTKNQAIQKIMDVSDEFEFDAYDALPDTPNPILVEIFHNYGKDHRDYWYNKRGYSDETIDKFKLGYTGKYWVIPIYHNNKFMNFQRRGVDTNGNKIVNLFYKGIGGLPFNFDYLPADKKQPIFITESPVDAIMLTQQGYFAISSTNGAMSWDHQWSKTLFDYETIYICYDNDEAGINGALRTATHLQHNSSILHWPDGYPNKFDITDLFISGGNLASLMPYFVPSYVIAQGKVR